MTLKMNRSDRYVLLAVIMFAATVAAAQPTPRNESLDATLRELSMKANQIGTEVTAAMAALDVDAMVKDAQQMARISKAHTRILMTEIEKIDLRALTEQARSLAEEASRIDWQEFQGQTGIPNFAFQKEKVIEKSYPITASHALQIDNRYGKVAVHSWNRNEIKVTIRVRTAERSERLAQEALDRVTIDETKTSSRISLKTVIQSAEESGSWWTMLTSGGHDRALNIDYEIYMPSKNELAVTNRYGAIELADRDGKTAISVSYGSLTAGRLNASSNSVSIAYSNGDIAYINVGDVSAKYGGFTLGEAERLTLALSYTSGSEIGMINREANINLKYSGGFELGLGKSIQKASVSAAYSSVRINPAPDTAFDFNVAVSYGSFDYNDKYAHINNQSGGNTSKNYTGYWNKSGNNVVSISSRYGGVAID